MQLAAAATAIVDNLFVKCRKYTNLTNAYDYMMELRYFLNPFRNVKSLQGYLCGKEDSHICTKCCQETNT